MNNDPADQVASYVLQSITEPPHKYVSERHYPLPKFFFHGRDPAYRVAVAQATEHVQTDEDFDATAQGYFDLLEAILEPWAELQAILDPSESEHDDDCDCNECPF